MEFFEKESVLQYYRILTVIIFSIGSALLITSIIDPQLPIQLINAVFPDEPEGVAQLLHISQQVLLILYGVLTVLVAVFMRLLERSINTVDESFSEIVRGKLSLRFLTLLSFSATFIAVRAIVALSGIVGPSTSGKAGALPVIEISLPGFEIDHFFIGFLILVIVGYIAIFREEYPEKLMAVLYGAGLGIFVDEIGMLLTEGNYFTLSTYVFATIFAVAFLLGIYFELKNYNKK